METNKKTEPVATDENTVSAALSALRSLQDDYAFDLPVPEVFREDEQSPNTLIVQSTIKIDDNLSVVCRATIASSGASPEGRAVEVRVCERNAGTIAGRSEVTIVHDLADERGWRRSVRIGKDRSAKIEDLCNRLGLNRIESITDEAVEEEKIFVALSAVARWANEFQFLT